MKYYIRTPHNLVSNMPTIDEFPIELGELLDLMYKLAVDKDLTEKVIEDAVSNELLYRFGGQPISDALKYAMKTQIQVWCDIICSITGREISLEGFELK